MKQPGNDSDIIHRAIKISPLNLYLHLPGVTSALEDNCLRMTYTKAVLILLFAIYHAATACAQDVTYSQYDKFDFRDGDYAVVGMTGGRLYNYRKTSDGTLLDAYDDSMNKT